MSRAAIAFLVSLAAWLPSLRGRFVYDDHRMVLNNPILDNPGNLPALLSFDPARPLLTLSWLASHALGGKQPWAYVLVNVVLHATSAALVFGLCRWLARERGESRPQRLGLIAALCFGLTPMAAETVTYVSSRSTGLAACLGLGFLALAAPALAPLQPRRLLAAAGLLALAHASKEEAAALPALLVLLDLYGPARGSPAAVALRWRVHAFFFAFPVLGLLARRAILGSLLPAPAWPMAVWLRTQAAELAGYLGRAFVPFDPMLFRGVDPAPWPPDARSLVGLLTLSLILALVTAKPRSSFALSVLWMAAALAPSSTLVSLKELVVDHRAYLGGAGVAYAVASFLSVSGRGPLVLGLLFAMLVRGQLAMATFADPERIWDTAVERAPESVEARLGLGVARLQGGAPDQAAAQFEEATRLAPGDARAWANLATAEARRGRFDQAVVALERALALEPGDARLHYNLGTVQAQTGRLDLAEAAFRRAVERQPSVPPAFVNLASLLLARGERDEARKLVEGAKALRLDPQSEKALRKLESDLSR